MKKSGIYCIENIVNKKKYIGQAVNLEKRKHKHFWMLEKDCHTNSHLQNSYNKYGKNNFKFRILLYCKPSKLTKYEQIFVDYYIPELLYNVRLECVDSNQGITFSKEAKRKMSEARRGENHPMYGKHHSKETKEKISKANNGENNPMYGKHLSKEAKEKISKTFLGENSPRSKLTENQIFEILDLYYNKSKTQIDIAKIFFVNNATICRIVRGKRWKLCYKKFMEK